MKGQKGEEGLLGKDGPIGPMGPAGPIGPVVMQITVYRSAKISARCKKSRAILNLIITTRRCKLQL